MNVLMEKEKLKDLSTFAEYDMSTFKKLVMDLLQHFEYFRLHHK